MAPQRAIKTILMQNHVASSNSIDLVLAADIKGGDLVIQGDLIGVAVSDGDATRLKAVKLSGVFSLKKKTSDTFSIGAKVYWETDNKQCTSTSTDNTLIGVAFAAAAGPDTTMFVGLKNGL